MKYKELISKKLIEKLLATSFESPNNNLKVYEWCNEIMPHIDFLENERIKLVKRYGDEDKDGNISVKAPEKYKEFIEKFDAVLNMDIEKQIPKCPIEKDWFDNEKCNFAKDKALWISPAEIGIILKYND